VTSNLAGEDRLSAKEVIAKILVLGEWVVGVSKVKLFIAKQYKQLLCGDD